MKTIQEQLAVMQHFAAGGEVECKNQEGSNWGRIQYPSWDWLCFDYRIKEPVDPYAELKAAAADPTKQIRWLGGAAAWGCTGYKWGWLYPANEYEIRDKPKPTKKVKLKAWFDSHRLVWLQESTIPADYWKRVSGEDKEIEVEV